FGIARAVFNLLPLTHHAQVTVVQAQNLGREAVLLAGGEFLDVHLNRTLARDDGDLRIGVGHLRTHRIGQPYAHGAEATGIQPAARRIELVVLRGPHLVLAHVGGDDGAATRNLT